MTNSKTFYLLSAVLLLAILTAVPILRKAFSRDDISINISESPEELSVTAKYPQAKSTAVQEYLQSRLALGNLPDLNNIEVKSFQAAGHKMNIDISSHKGELKLVMDRRTNTSAAFNHLKRVGNGLGDVLK